MGILGRGLTGSLYTVPVGKQSSAFINICNSVQPYQLVGASYDSVSFSVASQETSPYSLAFNNDGAKFYILGTTNDTVFQYSAGAVDTTTRVYLRESGTTGNPTRSELVLTPEVAGNDTFASVAYVLSAGESIYVEQTSGSAVFTVNGIEETV